MASWAPDLVTPADRANLSASMAKARDIRALKRASQSELSTLCSQLNQKERLETYGFSTIDNTKRYCGVQEQPENHGSELLRGNSNFLRTLCFGDTAHRRDRDTKTQDRICAIRE